ncbi:hypothetical protein BGP77_06405 [Saccharospirillum sp. MSK14-1]|uniref:hypothetical protein n=1 Tax=Saccharospirillum sp. MSK14-1 TaxID=1897632 RepID=UPI000D353392|nr:hypothetical protein [Saccharospirillum sp. MSK14-1]PTY36912.1 hypothetical protein BGP77_06405 [Saccharospirillum sp. MSK14-1]
MRPVLVEWLRRRTESPRQALKQFTTGGFIFCAGMMIIVFTDKLVAPSMTQEAISLFGLLLIVAGGLYALGGYLALSVFRVLLFILEPRP